ncbi:AAA family ATPase [Agromyces sp. GXS1127]|uniref:AAA family ATPase n=1 Tax=Agromyces sp. GXS1127 TaxID=3424181 RepID=UPI003D31806B
MSLMDGPQMSDDELESLLLEEEVRQGLRRRAATREVMRRERIEQSERRDAVQRLMPGGEFIFSEPDEIPAVWGTGERVLWAEGEGLMIAGSQGLGKTTIAQQLVLSRIAIREGRMLGLPVQQSPGRVLYLAMDRPRQAARSFKRMVEPSHHERLNERVIVWRGPLPVSVLESPQALADWVQEVDPAIDLVVVDSVKDLAPGLSSDEVGAGLNSAWQELIARGIQLLLLHHERKNGNGQPSRAAALDDIYGSTWLTSGLGSVVQIIGKREEPTVTLHHLKAPAEFVGPLTVEHDHAAGTSTLLITYRTVEEFLQTHFGEAFTAKECGEAVNKGEKAARAEVKRLVEQGSVIETAPAGLTSAGRTAAKYQWRFGAVSA